MDCKHINTVVYAIIDSGVFGLRIISGLVTGVKFTEDKPSYSIEFNKNQHWTSLIAEDEKSLIKLLNLPSLDEVKEKHGLEINFKD